MNHNILKGLFVNITKAGYTMYPSESISKAIIRAICDGYSPTIEEAAIIKQQGMDYHYIIEPDKNTWYIDNMIIELTPYGLLQSVIHNTLGTILVVKDYTVVESMGVKLPEIDCRPMASRLKKLALSYPRGKQGSIIQNSVFAAQTDAETVGCITEFVPKFRNMGMGDEFDAIVNDYPYAGRIVGFLRNRNGMYVNQVAFKYFTLTLLSSNWPEYFNIVNTQYSVALNSFTAKREDDVSTSSRGD